MIKLYQFFNNTFIEAAMLFISVFTINVHTIKIPRANHGRGLMCSFPCVLENGRSEVHRGYGNMII